MRQLRPGLTCHFGKTFFFLRKRNQIHVSLYVSHNRRWVSHSLNPTGVVKTMIVGHWVRASGTLRATSRHWWPYHWRIGVKLFTQYLLLNCGQVCKLLLAPPCESKLSPKKERMVKFTSPASSRALVIPRPLSAVGAIKLPETCTNQSRHKYDCYHARDLNSLVESM